MVVTERLATLPNIILTSGAHDSIEAGACVMELVSWINGEPWSDHPACVSPVIGAFMRRWNDDLDDEGRQDLKALIPSLIGTIASPEIEDQRGWMCADWLVRAHAPAWLELAGCTEAARGLRDLPPIVDLASLDLSRPAARDAPRDAPRDALKPIETALMASAADLVERMCALSNRTASEHSNGRDTA